MEWTSMEMQTGWKRPAPKTICQDLDVLQRVWAFTYDIQDPAFRRYFKRRYCMDLDSAPNGISMLAASHPHDELEEFQRITRAKLQDAWELYNLYNEGR